MQFVAESSEEEDDNIWLACSNNNLVKIQYFLSQGVNVNVQDDHGYAPLHAAVSWNNLEIVQFLLQSGANIHIKDEEGDTPLLYCEQPDILLLLVQSGANLSDVNVNGEGLIDKAIEDNNIILLQYMIENKLIDDNKVDKIMQLMSERIEVNETGYDEINENWTEQTEDDDEQVSE